MSLKVNNAESRRYRSRTTAERRTERRDKLIEAATEAFASDGYSNTSIEQLCSMAGISARNFYEEFGSKEELLHALYDDINVRAIEAAASSLAKADPLDFKARAGAGVTAYLKTMTADRRMARIAHIESVGVSAAMEAHERVRFAHQTRSGSFGENQTSAETRLLFDGHCTCWSDQGTRCRFSHPGRQATESGKNRG